ncbi:M23 family metallopeptidase [Noviherbaspirillum cavernae]|uniref:M23 family metallopeptidase n=1 Tax=Noviherbaspirillum cavernae TaxID=2320862 RepID=UPI001314BD3B|nr:M23 family metallopeptidase [Noviherbaspirillum cavernae]
MNPSARRRLTLLFAAALACLPAIAGERAPERITPLLLSIQVAPIPVAGSDGQTHLVYELWIDNFSSAESVVEKIEVLAGDRVLHTLDGDALAGRLRPGGQNIAGASLAKSTLNFAAMHLSLPRGANVPRRLSHRVTGKVRAAPPGQQQIVQTGAEVAVENREAVVIGPPLRGERYIAADSCCDAVRHTRAALPVNGRIRLAQRFAVDWEQLDAQGRIYNGPQKTLTSYTIFGQPVLAVADARVVSVVDGLPEQTPGTYPENIAIEDADGNSVVLDLGGGRHALYAHMQPGSIAVKPGERVRRGQVLGRVGNSGNSVAPHLHFHVMDGPSPLDSNGLPYRIDTFWVSGNAPSTDAFDDAEAKGTPLAVIPVTPPRQVSRSLPMDQLIVRFGP